MTTIEKQEQVAFYNEAIKTVNKYTAKGMKSMLIENQRGFVTFNQAGTDFDFTFGTQHPRGFHISGPITLRTKTDVLDKLKHDRSYFE